MVKCSGVASGKVFRRVNRAGKTWGESMTEKVVWHVVREFAKKAGIDKLAPHELEENLRSAVSFRRRRAGTDPVSPRSRLDPNHRAILGLQATNPVGRQRQNRYRAEELNGAGAIGEGWPTIHAQFGGKCLFVV